ncbi:MAG: Mov34/MPN/PAD-1 family protein [Candidatus Lokiarchaeota archaeon]|nr:Mov34/MPN/PAD-1 family protein [Candidatus Lokiarchaeota archaeon]
MGQLNISRDLQMKLMHISRSHYPQESCAALFGRKDSSDDDTYYAEAVVELHNVIHSSVEFQIDEMELFHQCIAYDKKKLLLIGIFHSHPDDAYVSTYDRVTIQHIGKLYPYLVWVIFGNQTVQMKAYILQKKTQVKEIPIIFSDKTT